MNRRLIGVLLALLLPAASGAAALTPVEQLGKDIFFDSDLSTPPGQACASCHDPSTGFVGPVSELNQHGSVYPGAVHARFGNRKPPTSAYASFSPDFHFDPIEGLYLGGMFWDGRALNTVEQAKGPFLNPLEMNNPNPRAVIKKILKSPYAGTFEMLFAEHSLDPAPGPGKISELSLDIGDDAFVAAAYQFTAEAIAAYEASAEVNSFSSRYDAYLRGETMLTDEELWGLTLFEGKAMCSNCHPSRPGPNGEPPLFTDFTYDNLGVYRNPENPWYTMPPGFNPEGEDWVDYGLGEQLGLPEEMGKHKVPTLRNVGMRPYLGFVQSYTHNGALKSLRAVVHFYNTRDVSDWPPPEVPENVNTEELGNLGLCTLEENALVAFLLTLTDGWTPEPALAAQGEGLPRLTVAPAMPNPFRGATRIGFELVAGGDVSLDIFDIQGRRVCQVVDRVSYPAGLHQIPWDGLDAAGRAVAPGVYFTRLQSGSQIQVQRVVRVP